MNYFTRRIEQYSFFEEHERFISKLPEYEQVLLDYYKRRMTQEEIAKILLCTQGGVSSRLRRIVKRLSFLEYLDRFNLTKIDEVLRPICHRDDSEATIDLEVIKGMIQTTCQSGTANIVNNALNLSGSKKLNQVKVRYRFKTCLGRLKQLKSNLPKYGRFKYKYYLELLEMIDNNLYMLYEVKLPHFDRG